MSSTYPPASGQLIRRCSYCRTPLSPDGTICGSCGSYTALPQIAWGGSQGVSQGQFQRLPQQPVGTFQHQMPGQAPTGSQWGNGGFAQAIPPAPLSPPSLLPPVSGALTNGMHSGAGYYYQGAPGNQGLFGMTSNVAPGFSNANASYNYYQAVEEEERRPRIGLIIGMGVLALLVIGGGLIGLLYFTGQQPSTATPTSTFVVKTPSVKPLFHDTFANNSSGWLISNTPGASSQQVGGGLMTLEDDNNQLVWEIVPGKTFSDFRLDADARLAKGDPGNGYGVYIRGAPTATNDIGTYYRLELYGDGTFAFFKGALDGNGNTIDQQVTYSKNPNPAILTEGHSNHITILAKGGSMVFMVNGTTIFSESDTTYRSGLIALFVSNLPGLKGGTQATFANLAIFPAS